MNSEVWVVDYDTGGCPEDQDAGILCICDSQSTAQYITRLLTDRCWGELFSRFPNLALRSCVKYSMSGQQRYVWDYQAYPIYTARG